MLVAIDARLTQKGYMESHLDYPVLVLALEDLVQEKSCLRVNWFQNGKGNRVGVIVIWIVFRYDDWFACVLKLISE